MKEIYVMYIILIIGFILGYILYTKFGIRAPGVIAAPLLALYTLENIKILYVVIIIATIIYVVSQILYKKWFVYGRKLFLVMCTFSVLLTIPIMSTLNVSSVAFVSILPAIFAYNITINGTKIYTSIGTLILEVGLLIGIGYVL